MARKRKTPAPAVSEQNPTEQTPTPTPVPYQPSADDTRLVRIGWSEIDANGYLVKDIAAVEIPLKERDNLTLFAGAVLSQGERQGREPFVKKPNTERNAALVRLRDEVLPDGRRRTFKEVHAEMKRINSAWIYKDDNAVRRQYDRLKARHD